MRGPHHSACNRGAGHAEADGGAVKLTWTDEMTTALRNLRQSGLPLYECAERIGVSYKLTVYKARELGIAHRLNHGNVPGSVALTQRNFIPAPDFGCGK